MPARSSPPIGDAKRSPIVEYLLAVPVERALFALLWAFVSIYPWALERPGMIDNHNYVQNFIDGMELNWIGYFTSGTTPVEWLASFVVEEPLWALWTTLLGSLIDAQVAVVVTASLLNFLVGLAVSDYRYRVAALLLWLVVPMGFAVIGTYQLRQGFAFAVWLLLAVRHRRLVIGSGIAALIHSTFVIVAGIAVIAALVRIAPAARLFLIALASVAIAVVGQSLFERFGGRRVEVYLLSGEEYNLTFLISTIALMAYPLILLLSRDWRLHAPPAPGQPRLLEYCIVYVGIQIFIAASFFLFPVGTYRLPYLTLLGLIPILGNLDLGELRRGRLASIGVLFGVLPTLVMLAYWIAQALANGRYACLYVPQCADAVIR